MEERPFQTTDQGRSVVVYARVSKAEREDATSVPVQLAACRKRAAEEGWEVVGEYADEGVSAWDTKKRRPEFERMLASVESGLADTILVREGERLLRQLKDGVRLLDLHEAGKLRLIAHTMESDIDLSRARDRKEFRDRASAAVFYSDFLSDKVRESMAHKAESGEWKRGGYRPYGYEQVGSTLVVHKREAKVIREAATRILNGESRVSVVRDFHARGFRTSLGKPWSLTRLAEVLRSPTIAGLRIHRGEIVGEGNWEPILDRDLWEKVGRTLVRAPTIHRGRRRRLLTGTVLCGQCGQRLSAKTRSDGIRLYKCPSDSAAACGALSVVAEPVERIVMATAWQNYDKMSLVPQPSQPAADDETTGLEMRLQELLEYEGELLQHRRDGVLSPEALRRELASLSDERGSISRKFTKLRDTESARGLYVITRDQLRTLKGPPETLAEADEETVEFWRTVVQGVFAGVVIRGGWRGKRFDPSRVILIPHSGHEDAATAVENYSSPWWQVWETHPWPVEGEEDTYVAQEWPKGE